MRNMSFALTTEQVRARQKTVTRRLGWTFLKPGDRIRAVVKCQGLKKGEKVEPLAVLRVVDVRREPLRRLLDEIGYGFRECEREGFPNASPPAFVAFFCGSHRWPTLYMDGHVHEPSRPCTPDDEVTRIEFVYDTPPPGGAVGRA